MRRAGKATLAFAVPPGLAFLVGLLLPAPHTIFSVASRFLLWVAAVHLLAPREHRYAAASKRERICGATFITIGAASLWSISGLPLLGTILVVAAAAAEEWIFRVVLPRWLAHSVNPWVNATYTQLATAAVLSQISFAVSHLSADVAGATISITALVRLFAFGCWYATIRAIWGVPVAVLIHSAANVLVISARIGVPVAGSRTSLLFWTLVGVCCMIFSLRLQQGPLRTLAIPKEGPIKTLS